MSLPELIPSDLPVFIRKALRSHFINSVVPQGYALLFAQSDSNGGVRFVTKNSDGSYTDVGGGGSADVILGVVDSNGKFQPLKFNGTDASESGQPIVVENYKTWNSTYSTPESSSTSPASGSSTPADIPTQGLYLYLPLSESAQEAETGQQLTEVGDLYFETEQGIPCIWFDGASGYQMDAFDLSQFSNGFTLSFWFSPDDIGDDIGCIFCQQSDQLDEETEEWVQDGQVAFRISDGKYSMRIPASEQTVVQTSSAAYGLHHITFVYDPNGGVEFPLCSIYIDGQLAASGENYVDGLGSMNDYVRIGFGHTEYDSVYQGVYGYMAALRLYSRVLTQAEINALASEFTPQQDQFQGE